MEQGMCQFKSSSKEIENYNENKVNLFFCWFVCVYILFYFEFFAIDSPIFSFTFVDLLIKLSFSRKLCSLKKILYML
jgi:hypothetical protein